MVLILVYHIQPGTESRFGSSSADVNQGLLSIPVYGKNRFDQCLQDTLRLRNLQRSVFFLACPQPFYRLLYFGYITERYADLLISPCRFLPGAGLSVIHEPDGYCASYSIYSPLNAIAGVGACLFVLRQQVNKIFSQGGLRINLSSIT